MPAPALVLDPRAYATTLLVAAIDRYGLDVTTWTPETVEIELAEDLRAPVPAENLAKLFVAIRLLTSDDFYTSPADFCLACSTLSGHPPADGQLIVPDADDVAWAVTEATLLAAPDGDNPFSQEVLALIGAILDEESILVPPDVLRLAVRQGNMAEKVRYDYSDDPTMFQAMFAKDKSRTDDIDALVAGRMRGLLRQLGRLPLLTADAAHVRQLAEKLAAGLPAVEPLDLIPN